MKHIRSKKVLCYDARLMTKGIILMEILASSFNSYNSNWNVTVQDFAIVPGIIEMPETKAPIVSSALEITKEEILEAEIILGDSNETLVERTNSVLLQAVIEKMKKKPLYGAVPETDWEIVEENN